MRKTVLAAFAAGALALTGACAGDDANVDANIEASAEDEGSVEEYCDMAAELDALDGTPSDEQLDEIVELAPEEIKDDVETLARSVKEQDFDDPETEAAGNRVEEWEADNCPERDDQGGEDGAGTDAPEGGDDADNGTGTGSDGGGSGGNSGPGGGTQETDDTGGSGAEVETEVEGGTDTTH